MGDLWGPLWWSRRATTPQDTTPLHHNDVCSGFLDLNDTGGGGN